MLNKKISIVIDLQVFQAEFEKNNANHDIIDLVITIAERTDIELTIILNGLFKDDISDIRKLFLGIIPSGNIRTWFSPDVLSKSTWQRSISELIREEVLLSLSPDLIILPGVVSYTDPRVIVNHITVPLLAKEELLIAFGLEGNSTSFESLVTDVATNDEVVDLILGFCNEQVSGGDASSFLVTSDNRPKLAFVSPLPPLKSGISFYSSDLIKELIKYYDIDVITEQDSICDDWILSNCQVLNSSQFLENNHLYERIMYQVGNSPMHAYMYDLMAEVPGLVVLHDLYLGDLTYYIEHGYGRPYYFENQLYSCHGYRAFIDYNNSDIHQILSKYPISADVFSNAKGVVLHSNYANKIAAQYYPELTKFHCYEVPLFRTPSEIINKSKARKELNLNDNDFVVTSFGHIGRNKLYHCIIMAWMSSLLHENKNCKLIFVGENGSDDYCLSIEEIVNRSPNINITGWNDDRTYKNYLAASDVSIQLRSESRGETSAAVLDCMNYGISTIINANGAMAELDDDAVLILPHEMESNELIEDLTSAIERLEANSSLRDSFAKYASELVINKHSLNECAMKYVTALEETKNITPSTTEPKSLLKRIEKLGNPDLSDIERMNMSLCISDSFPAIVAKKRLFIDVSIVADNDLRTGIQRVVRSIVIEMIKKDLDEYLIEPVFLSNDGGRWHYRYARKWTAKTLGIDTDWAQDEVIDCKFGDQLLILDFTSGLLGIAVDGGVFEHIRNKGVTVTTVIYDLLPIQFPNYFPADIDLNHKHWMNSVLKLDGGICISESVAKEVREFIKKNNFPNSDNFPISWFHLGADIDNSSSTRGVPDDADRVLECINDNITFLMVGTIEPRKGNAQVFAAVKKLWEQGMDINLVMVGKRGWVKDDFIESIKTSPYINNKLFWLDGISDDYLEKLYESSSCLIAASEGEGFGLPLIEAAQHNIPIIARDISVFREVAGEYAYYFDNNNNEDLLANTIKQWLNLYERDEHPKSYNMPYFTWQESSLQLLQNLGVN